MGSADVTLTLRERETVEEVIAFYDFTEDQSRKAIEMIEQEWHATSGRFRAYTVAHRVCAEITTGAIVTGAGPDPDTDEPRPARI